MRSQTSCIRRHDGQDTGRGCPPPHVKLNGDHHTSEGERNIVVGQAPLLYVLLRAAEEQNMAKENPDKDIDARIQKHLQTWIHTRACVNVDRILTSTCQQLAHPAPPRWCGRTRGWMLFVRVTEGLDKFK